MLKNYFKIAWRNIIKSRFYSLVNIIGLSVGIAFTLLIGAYVYGQLQVNAKLNNADNQYVLQGKWKDPNMGYPQCTFAELPKALKDNYPNLIANYYHWDGVSSTISRGDKHYREGIQIGDSTMLNMYGFKLLYGNGSKALADPFAIVVTKHIAEKYFGKTDVVGQTLNIENFSGSKHDFTITAVMDDTPENSVLDQVNHQIYMPATAARYMGRNLNGWDNVAVMGFIELKQGVNPARVDQAIQTLVKQNAPARLSTNLKPYMVSLHNYYLDGAKKRLQTLAFIGLFILAMAIINFVNMCIGHSSGRMKEMGIRKVLGGMRKQLIWQFLVESVMLVCLATVVAMLIYIPARAYFSDAIGKELIGIFSFPLHFYLIPVVFAIVVGILAGLYPALILSALKSVDSLKGKLAQVKDSVLTRKVLVGFQFSIAMVVLISALVISQQINLFFNTDLGYNKDYIVYAPLPRDWSKGGVEKMETIRYQLAQKPGIGNVSLSWEIPNGNSGGSIQVYKPGADSTQSIAAQVLMTDNQYAATYNIPLKAGEFFTPNFVPGDEAKIVINEAQARALGWRDPKQAIDQQIKGVGNPVPFTISGVVADFHFESMQRQIMPLMFMHVKYTNLYRYFSIKLKADHGNMQQSIASLQKSWNQLLPGAPFEYKFIDDALSKMYTSEIQLKKAAYIATVLAIIIVLLGILGLISLSIQKRTKEIGIRKVLGSSVAGISMLFLKDFLGVVIIAGLLACPIAYLIMQHWLNDYAYKITLNLNPFIVSVTLLTLVTALVITLQTIKAAFANPVKSLRSE